MILPEQLVIPPHLKLHTWALYHLALYYVLCSLDSILVSQFLQNVILLNKISLIFLNSISLNIHLPKHQGDNLLTY